MISSLYEPFEFKQKNHLNFTHYLDHYRNNFKNYWGGDRGVLIQKNIHL